MPDRLRIISWIKLISITGGAQMLIQGIGLISGIIIIRLLPTKEYALYTLANTMLGTMTLIADSGISSGVMAQGGKVWQQKKELGIVLATGLDLRKKLGLASIFITSPVLIYLLLHHGASWIIALLITLALIPAFFAGLSDSLYEIIPKLHQDIKPLQKNQVMVSIIRLVLTCLTLFVFPFTFIAVLAAGVPRIYGNIRLKRISYMHAEKDATSSIEIRKKILQML
ncbi:MAG: polysaccharide biosynthesis protein, partial [Mucilaginibacter sp.]|nr:polysaccharide biosynthesis protein [Mucilaginibacter sp.]